MMLTLRSFFLLLVLVALGGCEIIRVQFKDPITTSVLLEKGSVADVSNQLGAINTNLEEARRDFKTLVTYVTGGGGILTFLGLTSTGGYFVVKKRRKRKD